MIREYSFKGKLFKVSCVEQAGFQHPSWFSFEDEAGVRDEFWGVSEGDVVFDIGAAYGSYSLTALACGAAAVHAWSPPEADPPEPALFEESLRINGWIGRAFVYRTGLYSQRGWLRTDTQQFSTVPFSGTQWSSTIRVSSLDASLPRGVSRIDWMKLDVEGAEVFVLKGAEGTVKTYRPKVLVENHNFKDPTLEEQVRALLTGWGYEEVATRPYHSVSHSLYRMPEKKS